MTREFMVGTVDDKPLLVVVYNKVRYFVDLDNNDVFEDKPGLPKVKDEDVIANVLEQADSQ
tara:strand:- start:3474 stop:3656 length:183 start_codon:yes stop_codon:yes gene_type:complete